MTAVVDKSVSVLIVDDHPLVRRALRCVIESQPNWRVAGEAASGREGIAKALELQPDIMVLDLGLPEVNGVQAMQSILQAAPATRVLVLTLYEAENLVEDAIRAGAAGYVLKSDLEEELIAGIVALIEAKTYFNSPTARIVYHRIRAEERRAVEKLQVEHLSEREREILALLSQGNSNRQVAARLKISLRTVENHRSHIMNKLDVHSYGDLLRLAIRIDLVEP